MFSSELLGAYYNAQTSVRLAGNQARAGGNTTGAASGASQRREVLPPWDPRGEITALEVLRRSVLANGTFFEPKFGSFASLDTGTDEKSLFALHQGLRRLQSLAAAAGEKTASAADRAFWDRRFQEGMTQLDSYFGTLDLTGVSVLRGEELSKAESTLAISRGTSEYTTATLHTGAFDDAVTAFQGDTRFTITVHKNGGDIAIAIDLANMGATPRTLDNVATHINTELEANGILTRFERVKIGTKDSTGVIPGNDFGFKIKGILTERVSFAPESGAPAVYMAGLSGSGETASGQLTKMIDMAGGGTAAFTRRIEADPTVTETTDEDGETKTSKAENPLEIKAIARSSDGGVYVVGHTSSAIDNQALKGEQDLVLMRYDSTGKKIWSRVLGAGEAASGAAVAVDGEGNVVVAGSVKGDLGGTNGVGGLDSLVVKYSSDGVEQWARRFGGLADDRVDSVSVGGDGTIYLGGQANSNIGGVTNQGGTDGYLRALDGEGATLYTRSAGAGAGTQTVKGTALAADGGLVVATEEAGRAVLTKYAAGDDGSGAPVWTLDLGDLDDGRIGGITVDENGDIFLAGAAGPGFAPGTVVTANAGGRDAVLVKISDGASASVAFTTFLGSAEDNSAAAVTAAGGKVYITGKTSSALPGGEQSGARNAFAASLDAASGAVDWVRQVSGRGGLSEGAGIVVDPTGDNVLNRLGLPTGAITYSNSRLVTDRSAVREGDHFFISVDGGRKKKITIAANDTMRSLSFKLNAALLLDATADVRRSANGDMLRIKPKVGVTVEFLPGAKGADALQGLGLPVGAVTGKASLLDGDSTSDAPKAFALELPTRLGVADRDAALAATEALTDAMSKVQRAYRELTTDPALKDLLAGPKNGKRGGTVPAYLQAQLANYSAGLERLGGGGSTIGLF